MDRRGFLGSLLAGTAVIMLPSLAANPTPIVSETLPLATTADLTSWMEAKFACELGRPAAFFELPLATAMRKYGRMDMEPGTEVVRFSYTTIAIGIEGDDPVEAERRLCIAMAERFEQLAKKQPLVWRLKPEFTRDEITEFGDTWMTKEEIEDRVDLADVRGRKTEWMMKNNDRHLVQWKFTPPSSSEKLPPIDVPENVEHDFSTDSLRYVKRKYTLNKLRMRLVLPHMLNEDLSETLYVQRDGETTVRI